MTELEKFFFKIITGYDYDKIIKFHLDDDEYIIIETIRAKACASKCEEEIIGFAKWYSGMEREKVESAYKRYLSERL